jgi:prepilin-type N-terminal cleavage/methylation domain-containing protein
MRNNVKKAFTLVELIVVITILAILGTIAFLSLQGYSADARNSKRTSDINNMETAITTAQAKGSSLLSFVTVVSGKQIPSASSIG